jgi:hypothetical protein
MARCATSRAVGEFAIRRREGDLLMQAVAVTYAQLQNCLGLFSVRKLKRDVDHPILLNRSVLEPALLKHFQHWRVVRQDFRNQLL